MTSIQTSDRYEDIENEDMTRPELLPGFIEACQELYPNMRYNGFFIEGDDKSLFDHNIDFDEGFVYPSGAHIWVYPYESDYRDVIDFAYSVAMKNCRTTILMQLIPGTFPWSYALRYAREIIFLQDSPAYDQSDGWALVTLGPMVKMPSIRRNEITMVSEWSWKARKMQVAGVFVKTEIQPLYFGPSEH